MRETFGHTKGPGEGVWIVPGHLAAGTISLIRSDLSTVWGDHARSGGDLALGQAADSAQADRHVAKAT